MVNLNYDITVCIKQFFLVVSYYATYSDTNGQWLTTNQFIILDRDYKYYTFIVS